METALEYAIGRIVATSNGVAQVEVETSAQCARCAAGKGCGAGLLGAGNARLNVDVELPPESSFKVGDEVCVSMEPSRLLHASFIAYGLPLAGTLLFVSLGWLFYGAMDDWAAAALAAAGLISGFLIGRGMVQRSRCLRHFAPTLGPERGI